MQIKHSVSLNTCTYISGMHAGSKTYLNRRTYATTDFAQRQTKNSKRGAKWIGILPYSGFEME